MGEPFSEGIGILFGMDTSGSDINAGTGGDNDVEE